MTAWRSTTTFAGSPTDCSDVKLTITLRPLPAPSTVDFMMQLWSSSNASRVTPAGAATPHAYCHEAQLTGTGDG